MTEAESRQRLRCGGREVAGAAQAHLYEGERASAGLKCVLKGKPLGFGDTPWGEKFSANTVLEALLLLENEDSGAGSSHDPGQRRSAQATADYDEVKVMGRHSYLFPGP